MSSHAKSPYRITDFQYMLSLYCPGKCVNCGIWKYEKSEITKGEIEAELFEKVLRSPLLCDANYIQLTGGEVQLSPKYGAIVEAIARIKPEATVHTNISGWYPETHYKVTKEALRHIDSSRFRIDISMDGPPSVYEQIRLVKNGFEKAVETTRRLRELSSNIRFVFTIYKENYREMRWLIDFAKEMDVDYYFEFARESSFLNNVGTLLPGMQWDEEAIASIEALLEESRFIERPDRRIKWERAKSIYRNEPLRFECHMGSEALVMDPFGAIYPCLEISEKLKMGNVKAYEGDLKALLNAPAALKVLETIRNQGCQPCSMLCVHKLQEA